MCAKNLDSDGNKRAYRGQSAVQPAKRVWQAGQDVFINYDLTVNEAADCKAWILTIDELDSYALKMVEEGYNITLNYDQRNHAYGCFIKCRDAGMENEGRILTGRGSTPFKALKQALYKHHFIFKGVWGSYDVLNNGALDD